MCWWLFYLIDKSNMNSWEKIWKIKVKIKITYHPATQIKPAASALQLAFVPFLLFTMERAQDDQLPPQAGLADPEVFDVMVFENRKKDTCH